MTALSPLDFADFVAVLNAEFAPDGIVFGSEDQRISQLEIDSLQVIRLLLFIEGLHPGAEIPEQLDLSTATVGDLHH